MALCNLQYLGQEVCVPQLLGNMGVRVLLHFVLLVAPCWCLCEQSAGLDGPLAGSSRALLMSLRLLW